MSAEIWVSFVAVAALVLMVPGATVVTVSGYAYLHGRSFALLLALVVAAAHGIVLLLSASGLGALIESSPELLQGIRIAGAAYLVCVMAMTASRLLNRKRFQIDRNFRSDFPIQARSKAIGRTFLVTVLNPNTIVFFVALLPQFVDASRSSVSQLSIMSATFVVLSALNSAIYGVVAARAARGRDKGKTASLISEPIPSIAKSRPHFG